MSEHAGDAEAALATLPEIAAAAGATDYRPCPEDLVTREFDAGHRAGAFAIFIGEDAYPPALATLPDAPPILWARGKGSLARRPAIALVGARNASSLGKRMARALATGLGAAGLTVASGLARGIDTVAHDSSLETGTIAVVAGGVDVVYPRENAALTARIAETGLILSEMPPGLQPQARHFPRRNRIISGLSRAVVVVEAAAKSGSLITARDALDQGREVFAVPGHPFDPRAAGCNFLIRDGAPLVRCVEDVLEAVNLDRNGLAPPPPRRREPTAPKRAQAPGFTQHDRRPDLRAEPSDTSVRDRILSLLGPSPLAEDQLLRDLSLSGQAVAEELLALEMDGEVVRQPGGLLARAS